MLNHGIILRTKNCVLRPTLPTDSEKIIELWNQPFVIGKLFMSKTEPAVYEKYFKEYETNQYQFRWTIEDDTGNFIGTISLSLNENQKTATSGHFAMYPTDDFINITPCVLINNYGFEVLHLEEINFTVLETNKKIIRFHKTLKAEFTDKKTEKIGSNGEKIILQHWRYRNNLWKENVPKFMHWINAWYAQN